MSIQGSKKVLIVLGMHRSGTSMLTRMINLHGAKLIGKMSKPNDYNESGYWESTETQQINDEILNFQRSAWFDWHSFPVASLPPNKRNYFESKITRFLTDHVNSEKAPMFVIKDPRICTLFPIWQSALRAAGVRVSIIITFRHPIEVAASLANRDDMTKNWGLLLWLRYMLDAERFTRDHPRVFLSYEKTMMDWQSSFQEMGKLLQLKWPVTSTSVEAEANGFISPDLKHHFWNSSSLGQINGLGRRAHKMYESLKKVELSEECGSLRAEFDLAHAEMELLSKPIEENVPRIIRTHLAFEKKIQLINEQELEDRKNLLALRTSGADRMAHLFTLREEFEAISSKRSKDKDSLKALAANLEKEKQQVERELSKATATARDTLIELKEERENLANLKTEWQEALPANLEKEKLEVECDLSKATASARDTLIELKEERENLANLKTEWQEAEKLHESRLAEQEALSANLEKEKQEVERDLSKTTATARDTLIELKEERENLANLKTEWQEAENFHESRLAEQEALSANLEKEKQEVECDLSKATATARDALNELEEERENLEESLAMAQLQSIQLDQQKLRIEERDRINHHLQERLNEMDEKALELLQTVRKLEKNKRELVISLSRRFEEITRLTQLMEEQDASGSTVMPTIFTRPIYLLTNKFHNSMQFFGARRLAKLIEKSDYFDAEWYLLQYPDVRAEGINPALHYIKHGAKEGRNPGQDFNSYEYLLANPDVAIENINPLVHFIKFGRKENRMSPPESNKRKAQ